MEFFLSTLIRDLTREQYFDLARQLESFGVGIDATEKDTIIGRSDDLRIVACLLRIKDQFPEIRVGISQYVGLARGLARIAKFGEVLFSQEIERSALEQYRVTSLGMLSIEGMKSQILVNRVDAPVGDEAFPGLQPADAVLPRAGDVDLLQQLLTVTKGVLVTAPPGCGKTVFFGQLVKAWPDRTFLRATCPYYAPATTLKPVREVVEQVLGLHALTGIEEKQKAVERVLRDLEIRDLGTAYLAVLDFMGLGDEESILEKLALKTRFEIITNSVSEILLKRAWKQPIVVLVEDAENMDLASVDFFQAIMQNLSYEPINFLFSAARPEISISGLKVFELRELEKQRLEELVENVTGERLQLPATTVFHAAQYLRLFREEKAVYHYHQYRGESSMVGFSLPFHDLRTIIKRRLDLLEDRKEMLYALTVCGCEIDPLTFPIDQKDFSHFDLFVQNAILEKRDKRYAFTSPLLHDALYNLVPDKEERHNRFADYYRRVHGCEEYAAFHYLAAGNQKKAVEFLMKSAAAALRQGGYQSSINHYNRALEICRRQKDAVSMETVLALNEGLADIYRALGDEERALKYYKVVLDSYKEILKE